jgi:hypothetical protein
VAGRAARPPPRLPANASLLRCLAAVPTWRRASYRRRIAIRLLLAEPLAAEPDRRRRRELKKLGRWVGLAAAGEVRAQAAAALLRSWRSLHRLFAISMLVTVGVHVGVAWYYGYRWIFS